MNGLHSVLFVWLSLISLVVNNFFVFFSSFVVKASDITEEEQVISETKQEDNLLQFTSSGSVIGFKNDGVIVASKDKMVSFNFVNSNNVTPQSDNQTKTVENNKPQELSKVTYNDVWDGITVEYEKTNTSILKSTYYLDNPDKVNSIILKYNRPIGLDSDGNLLIKFDTGNITETKPTAYQETPQGKHIVPVSFIILPDNKLTFTISNFLPNIPLIIDPALVWNTFLGASGSDNGYSLSRDSNGNIFVAGYSSSTWGTPVRAYTASNDICVAKLDSSGNLLWNTFLGASGSDIGYSVTLDTSNNIYVTGSSGATWGTPIRAKSSGTDGFVAKLDTNGNLLWNTFLGGSGTDYGYSITVNSSNIYVTGSSGATWGTPVRAYTSGNDSFVGKLDSSGNLLWNTFLGGGGSDNGLSIVYYNDSNIFIGGQSTATWGSPVETYNIQNSYFVVKVDSDGNLIWNTFAGGEGNSNTGYFVSISKDSGGNIFICSRTAVTWGTPIRTYTSGNDLFVAKINTNGNIVWNTFIGGSGNEFFLGRDAIAIDNNNNILVHGLSMSTWGSPVNIFSSMIDSFVAKIDSSGNLLWNTFLGGSGLDAGSSIVLDSHNNIYISGYTDATFGTPINTYTAGYDVFIAKLEGFPSVTASGSSVSDTGATVTWTTDVVGSSKVEYGLTTNYGTSTTETDTGTRVTSHSVGLSGLSSCTLYHYRVKSKDAGETEGVGSDSTFTTSGCVAESEVVASTTSQITTASGGTVSLEDGNSLGVELTVPASFGGTDANFQIHQLTENTVLSTTSAPVYQGTLAGNYIYELKALTDNSTVVSSFSAPLTLTISYSDNDVSNIIESTLRIYRYSNGSWNELNSCGVDTVANTVTCTTTNFSLFGLFGKNFFSEPGGTICNDTVPSGKTPWIVTGYSNNSTQATINFVNWQSPVTHFALEYGEEPNNYKYSSTNIGGKETTFYTINFLNPNTTYFFRVRTGNGCAAGDWSEPISITTDKSNYKTTTNKLTITSSTLEASPVEKDEEEQSKDLNVSDDFDGYSIKVKVTDTKKKPVEGASVTIHSKEQTGITDKNGEVNFTDVEKGQHTINITYKEYEGQEFVNLEGSSSEFTLNIIIEEKETPSFLESVINWMMDKIKEFFATIVK